MYVHVYNKYPYVLTLQLVMPAVDIIAKLVLHVECMSYSCIPFFTIVTPYPQATKQNDSAAECTFDNL